MYFESIPIRIPPESGGICGRLTQDLPLGYLQGGGQAEDQMGGCTRPGAAEAAAGAPPENVHEARITSTRSTTHL